MKFKVISSNIRFDNPADNEHAWIHRKGVLARALNSYGAHIVATQEGRRPQLLEVESMLASDMKIIDSHRSWISERMYPSIFINTNEIFIEESGDIWLSETPQVAGSKSFDSAFPRLCTWAIAAFKRTGRTFFIINAHLDHVKEKTRVKQIEVLFNQIRKLNSANHPLILLGDFNSAPDNLVREVVTKMEPSLYDPWIKMNLKEESSFHKFKGKYEQGSRIDWVLLDKRFEALSIELDKTAQDGIYPSDHFPVRVEIKL